MWSLACVIIMLAGIGLLICGWAFLRSHEAEPRAPAKDPVLAVGLTPSQKALGKYLFVVVALFVLLVFIGGFSAHSTLVGQAFYGLNVAEWFPYSHSPPWQARKSVRKGKGAAVRSDLVYSTFIQKTT